MPCKGLEYAPCQSLPARQVFLARDTNPKILLGTGQNDGCGRKRGVLHREVTQDDAAGVVPAAEAAHAALPQQRSRWRCGRQVQGERSVRMVSILRLMKGRSKYLQVQHSSSMYEITRAIACAALDCKAAAQFRTLRCGMDQYCSHLGWPRLAEAA